MTAFCVVPVLFREFIRRFDFARMHMVNALRWDTLFAISYVGSVFVLINADIDGPLPVLLAWAMVSAVLSFAWFALGNAKLFQVHGWCEAQPFSSWSHRKWFLVEQACWTATLYALHWITYGTLSIHETGILAASMTIASLLSPIWQGAGNFLSPKLAAQVGEGSRSETWSLLKKATLLLALLGLSFLAIVAVAGEFLLNLLFDGEFQGSGYLVSMLTLRMCLFALRVPVLHTLFALRAPHFAAYSSGVALAIMIVLGFPLASLEGLKGVAVASVISASTDLLVSTVLLGLRFHSWRWNQPGSCGEACLA